MKTNLTLNTFLGLFVLFTFTINLSLSAAPVSLLIGENNNLIITSASGEKVADIEPGTIGKAIQASPYTFHVSYGKDINNLNSVIISPNPTQPTSLSFLAGSKQIKMDKKSSVTITYGKNNSVTKIDPGYIGLVHVNGAVLSDAQEVAATALSENIARRMVNPPQATQGNYQVVPSSQKRVRRQAFFRKSRGSGKEVSSVYSYRGGSSKNVVSPYSVPARNLTRYIPPTAGDVKSYRPLGNKKGQDFLLLSEARRMEPETPIAREYNEAEVLQATSAGETPAVYARVPKFWMEPITPPNVETAKYLNVAPNEMKLLEDTGNVMVTLPGSKTPQPITNEMILPSGSLLQTGDDASVAVFIGGVNSIRLAEKTTARISHSLENGKRTTLVDVSDGLVFNKVGKKIGEIQSFVVKTPEGSAEAKGTDFAVMAAKKGGNNVLFCLAKQGVVDLKDSDGNTTDTLTPSANAADVKMASIPAAAAADMPKVVRKIFQTIAKLNKKTNAIVSKIEAGKALSPQEETYMDNMQQVDFAVKLIRDPRLFIPTIVINTQTVEEALDEVDGGDIKEYAVTLEPEATTPI